MAHGDGEDPLDDIVSAASPATRHWMVRKAILADGTRPGLPLLSVSRLERIIEERRHEPWAVKRGQCDRDGWSMAHVGLGRDLCGQTLRVLAERLSVSETKVRRLYATHRAEMQDETAYSLSVVEVASRELSSMVETWSEDRCGVRR